MLDPATTQLFAFIITFSYIHQHFHVHPYCLADSDDVSIMSYEKVKVHEDGDDMGFDEEDEEEEEDDDEVGFMSSIEVWNEFC